MGILYIAACLRQRGHSVHFLDADTDDLSTDAILREAQQVDATIVGITATTTQSVAAYRLAEAVKTTSPHIVTIVGGAHASAVREDLLRESPAVDIAVVGEGEQTMTEIADLVAAGGSRAQLKDIQGIAFRDGERPVYTGPREYVDINALPHPAVDLAMPLARYQSSFPPSRRELSFVVMGTRGCPFNCKFCGTSTIWGRKVRWRQPGAVVREIEHLYRDYGIDEIFFLDDTLNFSRRWIMTLCDEIEQSPILGKVAFKGSLRANEKLVDEALLRRLREVGFWLVAFGVESGNQDILDRINKKLTVEEIARAFRLAKEAGFETLGSFMIGNLGEDRRTVTDTIDLAKRIDPDYYDFPIATPLPGTEYRKEAEALGLIEVKDYSRYAMGRAVCRTEHLSLGDLEELRDLAFERMRKFADGISVEYNGMWRQDGDGIHVGRRDDSGSHADLSIRVREECSAYELAISYVDMTQGDVSVFVHDASSEWVPLGSFSLAQTGENREAFFRLVPQEANLPSNDFYIIFDTHGTDFYLAGIRLTGDAWTSEPCARQLLTTEAPMALTT